MQTAKRQPGRPRKPNANNVPITFAADRDTADRVEAEVTETGRSRSEVMRSLVARAFGAPATAAPCAICNGTCSAPGAPLVVHPPLTQSDRDSLRDFGALTGKRTPPRTLSTCYGCREIRTAMTSEHGVSAEIAVAAHLLGVKPNRAVLLMIEGVRPTPTGFGGKDPTFEGVLLAHELPHWSPENTPSEPFAFVDLAALKAAYGRLTVKPTHTGDPDFPCVVCRTTMQPVSKPWRPAPGPAGTRACYDCAEALETASGPVTALDNALAWATSGWARPGFAADYGVNSRTIKVGPAPFTGIDLHLITATEQTRKGREKPTFPNAVQR